MCAVDVRQIPVRKMNGALPWLIRGIDSGWCAALSWVVRRRAVPGSANVPRGNWRGFCAFTLLRQAQPVGAQERVVLHQAL